MIPKALIYRTRKTELLVTIIPLKEALSKGGTLLAIYPQPHTLAVFLGGVQRQVVWGKLSPVNQSFTL